jgi:hypothetical protein
MARIVWRNEQGEGANVPRFSREFLCVAGSALWKRHVSREMVRRVLGSEKGKRVKCIGRGPGARWTKIGSGKKG